MSHPTTILPFPADEIRHSALDYLNHAQCELSRLKIFFRGHQKSTHIIDSMMMRILSMEMSLSQLSWDTTQAEPEFGNPPPPPAPQPQEHTPTAPSQPDTPHPTT